MPDALDSAASLADPTPEDLVEVGSYRSWSEGAEYGLVVLAMSHPYWLIMADGTARLLVEPSIAMTARRELDKFSREKRTWPPQLAMDDAASTPVDVMSPMVWAVIVLLIFRLQLASPELTAIGELD